MPSSRSSKRHSDPEAPRRFGNLPPRYRFILNPYPDQRFTSCPDCGKLTKWRKFVLLVHIDPMHLLAQNIHCRFCPDCDLLIVHQDELEAQLMIHVSEHFPADVGNDYLVLGTMERTAWNENRRNPMSLPEILEHVADFREVLTIKVRPAGWYPKDED
jgi:hypothetical protein